MTRGVLHAIATLGTGGAERQLAYLTSELVRRGWDVHVVVRSAGQHAEAICQGGGIVHRLRSEGPYDPTAVAGVARLIRMLRPALVQTWLPQSDVVAGLAASVTRTPWILTERSSALAYSGGWRDRMRIRVAARADAIVANSAEGLAYWSARVRSDALLRVIPNGVRLDDSLTSVKPASSDGPPALLAVGRIVQREKNAFGVALAMRTVAARCGAVLDWCGDGGDRDRLCDLISFYELTAHVRVHRHCSDVGRRMRSAHAFVSASFFEGQPNAVLEAMANGCPIVVSDIPAHRAILDDQSASFFDPASPSELATAIVKTLERPDLARERAAVARRRIEQHSVTAMADAYERVYDEVAARRGR